MTFRKAQFRFRLPASSGAPVRGLMAALIVAALLALHAPHILPAQTVRGVLVDRGNVPVPGAVVLLVDSAANVVARSLSNDHGEFRVAATRAGRYRLRTMRIGYRPFTSESFALTAGEQSTQRLELASAQLSLDTVRVVSTNVCRVDRDSAASTFAVWEQVRTALTATQLTGAERNVSATVVSYDRHLDRMGHSVIGQKMSVASSYATQPWQSLTPDSLHRAGYVADNGTEATIYYAPSLDVLLSDVFLVDHCFHLTGGRDKSRLGIAFAPSPARKKTAELSGTVWLDRKSAQLRRLEFHYENILAEQQAESGGEMEFTALGDGTWVISRWNIRMPVLERVVRTRALGGDQLVISQIQVQGGELALAMRGMDTLFARAPLVLKGDVVDSMSGKPVSGATASLAGTALEARTDGSGRFSLNGVLPGNYTLEVHTPSLDSVNAVHQSAVEFIDGATPVRVRVPRARSLLVAMCGNSAPDIAGIVMGSVTVRGGAALPAGLRVVAEWNDAESTDSVRRDALRGTSRWLVTPVSTHGAYRLCNVPTNVAVVLQTEVEGAGAGNAQPVTIRATLDARVVRADLVLDSALVRGAVFAGVVYGDTAKRLLGDVEIVFPDLGLHALTNARGEFRLRDIPAGTHRVVVRRIGFGPVDARIAFASNQTVDRSVYLSRVTVIDSVVVTADRPEPWRQQFEESRKMGFGQFLTREQLERKEMQSLTSVLQELRGIDMQRGTSNHAWLATSHQLVANRQLHEGKFYDPDWFVPSAQIDLWHSAKPGCYADVFQDNVPMFTGKRGEQLFDLNDLSPAEIEAIEYYPDDHNIPSRYVTGRHCGALVIHMRRK